MRISRLDDAVSADLRRRKACVSLSSEGIIAAYRRALPLLVWIYELPFLCRLLREESPAPAFGRNIKSARYRYGFLQGSPFRLDIIALPFGQAWGQIPIPVGRCRVKRKPPPAFCGMPHIFRLHQSRSRPGAGLLQGAGRCRGGRRRRFALRAKPTAKPSSPPPCGGRAACGAPGGSARARGHSPSRSNRKSCGSFILRREQYPIRCGSTTVSSSPCRFLSVHK